MTKRERSPERTRNTTKTVIDPTTVRVSDHFLLSDFMNCNSVVSLGYKNAWDDPKNTKFEEISHLCETILEPFLDEFGPFSVSYGYVSPDLSRQIVRYMDPNLPSYHRWDDGAAVDICVHQHVLKGKKGAPIHLAHEIDQKYEYSRLITYSESPYICIASRVSEAEGLARRAFYENRFMGKVKTKPLYIQKPKNPAARRNEGEGLELTHDWRGSGYPTYHGGGRRQAQHVRVGRYCMLLDFLYNTTCVNEGRKNLPTPTAAFKARMYAAGKAYDGLIKSLRVRRFSIVRGYESPITFGSSPYNWKDGFIFQIVPPLGQSCDDVADAALALPGTHSIAIDTQRRIVTVGGSPL